MEKAIASNGKVIKPDHRFDHAGVAAGAIADDDVAEVRAAKQQVMNQQMALESGVAAAGAAKDLANAPVGTGNMLEQLAGQIPAGLLPGGQPS